MTDIKMFGPYEIEVKVHFTDGERVGSASWTGPMGRPMTHEELAHALVETEATVKDELGEDFRLCTKREFFDIMMQERLGTDEKIALPGGEEEWDTA